MPYAMGSSTDLDRAGGSAERAVQKHYLNVELQPL